MIQNQKEMVLIQIPVLQTEHLTLWHLQNQAFPLRKREPSKAKLLGREARAPGLKAYNRLKQVASMGCNGKNSGKGEGGGETEPFK